MTTRLQLQAIVLLLFVATATATIVVAGHNGLLRHAVQIVN